MWTRKELKERGKRAFRANYWPAVFAAFMMTVIVERCEMIRVTVDSGVIDPSYTGTTSLSVVEYFLFVIQRNATIGISLAITLISLVFVIYIIPLFHIGCCKYFIEQERGNTDINNLLYGFECGYSMNIVKIMLVRAIYNFLWYLLLFIPGVIKTYEYSMILYLLAENPNMDLRYAFDMTKKLMDNEKMNKFVLDLSFWGWDILSALFLYLPGIFYVQPYKQSTYAELYLTLREAKMMNEY